MLPLTAWSADRAREVDVVFTDIDDTLTTDGLLEEEAFSALWRLHAAGVRVVPVTGRPAGWCDHIARMWPVAGLVGENGGFAYVYDRQARKMARHYAQSEAVRAENRGKLAALREEILARVPRSRIAADQAFRELDLAVDFAEDVGPLSSDEIDEIVRVFEAHGATAKVSSIHVNGWFGSHDKLSMMKDCSRRFLGLDLDHQGSRAAYAGDSPNDEPAFAFFENSVGVANVEELRTRFRVLPKYVTPSRGGRGFSEFADRILASRRQAG